MPLIDENTGTKTTVILDRTVVALGAWKMELVFTVNDFDNTDTITSSLVNPLAVVGAHTTAVSAFLDPIVSGKTVTAQGGANAAPVLMIFGF